MRKYRSKIVSGYKESRVTGLSRGRSSRSLLLSQCFFSQKNLLSYQPVILTFCRLHPFRRGSKDQKLIQKFKKRWIFHSSGNWLENSDSLIMKISPKKITDLLKYLKFRFKLGKRKEKHRSARNFEIRDLWRDEY